MKGNKIFNSQIKEVGRFCLDVGESQDVTITLKNTEDGGIRVTIDYGSRGQDFRNYAHCIATKMVERYAEVNDDIDVWVVCRV